MTKTLSRKSIEDNPDSFEKLFQTGLGYIQELAGEKWTDYNLHDPGITILEQVCYALTDLIYRSEFPVKDFLAEETGTINYSELGLAHPDAIFSPAPQQPTDYEKWLLSQHPELEQVWVKISTNHPTSGLYCIDALRSFYFRQRSNSEHTKNTIASINQSYHQVRALCEDLEQTKLIGNNHVYLYATIELNNEAESPNLVAAKIYETTSQWLRENGTLKQIAALPEILTNLIGVEQITDLSFYLLDNEKGTTGKVESLPEHATLMIPESASDITIKLVKRKHTLLIDAEEVFLRVQQRQQQLQTTSSGKSSETGLPEGKYRQFSQYESIQTLLPRTYNLFSSHPGQYDAQQQAQRHQLRSYLLLFDQLMANFCQDLAGVKALFSTSLNKPTSYQIQALNNEQFFGIDQHYPEQAEVLLHKLRDHFDDYPERKGRIFDYLLAIYGESFPDDLYRNFSPYFSEEDTEWRLLKNKQAFIRNIAQLTNERGLGCNLCEPDHQSAYWQRLALFLGIEAPDSSSYCRAITQYSLHVVSDEQYTTSSIGEKLLFQLQEPILQELEMLPPGHNQTELSEELSKEQSQQIRASLSVFDLRTIPESLLQFGINADRYRILHRPQEGDYQLFFELNNKQQNTWLSIGHYRKEKKLLRSCQRLQQWLIQLNRSSEGFHLVEHITLRPGKNTSKNISAYAFQISIVLPGYTTRHSNPHLRNQVEALIREHTPAHLLVHVHWMAYPSFREFESRYIPWRKQKAAVLKHPDAEAQTNCDELALAVYDSLQNPESDDEVVII